MFAGPRGNPAAHVAHAVADAMRADLDEGWTIAALAATDERHSMPVAEALKIGVGHQVIIGDRVRKGAHWSLRIAE